MARILSRSKSLRMLRGHREPNQLDNGRPALPQVHIQTADCEPELSRLKAAPPVTRADGRVETPDISQRPRTSGGPADRAKAFHKRAVPTATSYTSSTSSLAYPSPEKSTTTILYAAEVHEDTEGVIGIALGSPTMNSHWNASSYGGEMGTVTHITAGPHADPPESKEDQQEAPKPKLSRWKSIFGRKQQPVQKQSFYQVAQSVVPPRADSHHDDDSIESRATSRAEEIYEEHRATAPQVYRVDIRESRRAANRQEQSQFDNGRRPRAATTTPNAPAKTKGVLTRSASSPRLRMEGARAEIPTVPQLSAPGNTQPPSSHLNVPGSFLDVNIPSIKLDRYSVMFGSLLQPGPNTAGNRSSSLLARRQGNIDRLKPLNELTAKEEDDECRSRSPRRATSPSLPSSPTFSLFPNTNPGSTTPVQPRSTSLPRVRPLQRSKTAPASSPSRPNFPNLQSLDVPQVSLNTSKPTDKLAEKDDINLKSQLLSPSPTSRLSFESEASDVDKDANTDADAETSIVLSPSTSIPWKPQLKEPEWEMVSKPTPLTALRSHPTGAALAQAPIHSASPSPSSSAPNITEIASATPRSDVLVRARSTRRASPTNPKYNRTGTGSQGPSQGATVGIARSVSVSRASPRSAEVVRTATVVRRMREKNGSAVATPTGNGRFGEQKVLTPTLVELRGRRSEKVGVDEA